MRNFHDEGIHIIQYFHMSYDYIIFISTYDIMMMRLIFTKSNGISRGVRQTIRLKLKSTAGDIKIISNIYIFSANLVFHIVRLVISKYLRLVSETKILVFSIFYILLILIHSFRQILNKKSNLYLENAEHLPNKYPVVRNYLIKKYSLTITTYKYSITIIRLH